MAAARMIPTIIKSDGVCEPIAMQRNTITIIDGQDVSDMGQIIFPIICEGDVIGSVVLMSKTEKQQVSDTEKKLVSVAADFLGRQMES